MSRSPLYVAAFTTLLALPSGRAHATVKVVTTTTDLAALVKVVGGDRVEVVAMALPTQDPHFVDPKPSLTLKLNKADLLIAVGLELESGWLPTLQKGARNSKITAGSLGYLDCSTSVGKLDVKAGAVDRSQGDIHPSGNPHYLYSPRRALECAASIRDKLATLDAENADVYRANYKDFAAVLGEKITDWETRIAPYRKAPIVSYHRSWGYLIEWLSLTDFATFEPKPGIPPSPSHVAKVLGAAKRHGVAVILQESYYPTKTGKLVAEKIGATLLSLDAGTDIEEGESYIDHMEAVVSSLEAAFAK